MEIIKTIQLTKMFGDFVANNQIDLTVEENEIKAIVGENGAGKSTLMNMLYGLLKPTAGEIYIRGEAVHFDSPNDAIKKGIGMVHQHFKLVPSLTIYENVILGVEVDHKIKLGKHSFSLPSIDHKYEAKTVQDLIDRFQFGLKATDIVKNLSIGAKQKVEILKMLYRNVEIVIFDEPTAVLTPQEIKAFFLTLKELKNQGKSIILITHKLQEVLEVSDSVTVIKQGVIIGNRVTKETTDKELARMMVGREVLLNVEKKYRDYTKNDIVYEVKNLTTRNHDGINVVNGISFHLRKGEILGIAGVEGNGQSELLDLLIGLSQSTNGQILFNGIDLTNEWPDQLRTQKIAFIPEDRYEQGLCLEMSIAENMIAGYHGNQDVCKHGLLLTKNIIEKRDRLIQSNDIRVSDCEGNVSSLSGGNAQKIIIAREFDANPELLIAAQPTRGVDIGAIEFIHKSLLNLQDQGKSILLISSELSEIMSLADRIAVIYKGQIIGEVSGMNASREAIGLLMAGIRERSPENEVR